MPQDADVNLDELFIRHNFPNDDFPTYANFLRILKIPDTFIAQLNYADDLMLSDMPEEYIEKHLASVGVQTHYYDDEDE